MNNQDYILMCDQTLEYLRLAIVGTRGDERIAIKKSRLLVMKIRTYYVRKERKDARHQNA